MAKTSSDAPKGMRVRIAWWPGMLRLEFVTPRMFDIPDLQNIAGHIPSMQTHITAVLVDPSMPDAGGSVSPGFRPRKVRRHPRDDDASTAPQSRAKKSFVCVEIISDLGAITADVAASIKADLDALGFRAVIKTPPPATPSTPTSSPTDPAQPTPMDIARQTAAAAIAALPDPGDEADDDEQVPT